MRICKISLLLHQTWHTLKVAGDDKSEYAEVIGFISHVMQRPRTHHELLGVVTGRDSYSYALAH
jgi:hypothetical protein